MMGNLSDFNTYKIPRRYYHDHRDCCGAELTPEVLMALRSHYFISKTPSPQLEEFISRCTLYALDEGGDYWRGGYSGVVLSARATLKAIFDEGKKS